LQKLSSFFDFFFVHREREGELWRGSVVAIAAQGYIGAIDKDFTLKFEFVSTSN